MKKFLSLAISVLLVMLTCVTASAAQVVKFNINLVSETDKEAVITLDYEGGVSFSGIDFDIEYNAKKVQIVEAKAGKGYQSFLMQGNTAIFQINKDKNPAQGTMACVPGFRVVDGKDVFTFKLKKLSTEALASSDFTVKFTNCTDGNFNQLSPSVTTDLQGAPAQLTPSTSADASTSSDQSMSEDAQSTNPDNGENAEPDTDTDAENTKPQQNGNEATDDNGSSGKTGFVVAGVVAVIVIAGIGVAVVIMNKKKKDANVED